MARTVRHFSVIVGPVFDAGSGQVRFVVYKVALGQFFYQNSVAFPPQCHSSNAPY